jgi:hypothetical protein
MISGVAFMADVSVSAACHRTGAGRPQAAPLLAAGRHMFQADEEMLPARGGAQDRLDSCGSGLRPHLLREMAVLPHIHIAIIGAARHGGT